MRRLSLLALAALALVALPAEAAPFPETIPLPSGFRPEGIAIGQGKTFYVGSIDTGAVYRGDLRTGTGGVLVPARDGRAAIGVAFADHRLWVAGGTTGHAFVYDADTGADIVQIPLTTGPTFINDVVVTGDAAYFTDSRQAALFRVDAETFEMTPLPLTGDFELEDGFNVNGIDATRNGKWLVIVQSNTGLLFLVNAKTGVAETIDLGGATLPNGDGILLHGHTLYVVQNFLNRIAVVELAPDRLSGVVAGHVTDPDFDIPTTIDRFGNDLYAVNARFSTPPTPTTPYSVVRAG